jgi:hypothetical protein
MFSDGIHLTGGVQSSLPSIARRMGARKADFSAGEMWGYLIPILFFSNSGYFLFK